MWMIVDARVGGGGGIMGQLERAQQQLFAELGTDIIKIIRCN
jgi:hypothetical protein